MNILIFCFNFFIKFKILSLSIHHFYTLNMIKILKCYNFIKGYFFILLFDFNCYLTKYTSDFKIFINIYIYYISLIILQ
jgi:hypothetical protein